MHDISLKTPRISSLAAKMYLEGDSQDWKAVEDRACMNSVRMRVAARRQGRITGEVFRPQGSSLEVKLISKDKDFLRPWNCYMPRIHAISWTTRTSIYIDITIRRAAYSSLYGTRDVSVINLAFCLTS